MKVLIACEESQIECMAFRALGHESYSCDIQEPSGGHPEWHILGDALEAIKGGTITTMDGVTHDIGKWDMMIAHPPCTDLASSGARWFQAKRQDGRQRDAIEFFCRLMEADIPVVVVENPVGIMSGNYVREWFPEIAEKYGLPYEVKQIVQPYHYGEHARKTTCLYGRGWRPLTPTETVDPGEILQGGFSVGASANCARDENGKILAWNDPRTAKMRSKSFPGIAKAMAEQWGGDVREEAAHETNN